MIFSHADSLPRLIILVYTHTHTLIITLHYTCGYDEIKGTQDFKIVPLMLFLSMILSIHCLFGLSLNAVASTQSLCTDSILVECG